MYVTKCKQGDNWNSGELVPYGNISISPASTVLNYGQGLFEGMKAYKTEGGRILLFRPEKNAERAAMGCTRLSMPEVPKNVFLEAVKTVVKDNSDYIP